ncbi:class A beta-lactamase-related serine hydrolase [Kitasatospora sp. NBC_00240]|uniref:serine hydrolase n=1 Tax=Kitasatospora sp. NBC_00240 TaxID=2903567 RepID=UPI002250B267|nr:serine hydrolase [Kitasatospora sp. NBC_00240]MCX5209290.1 class A beta-lactamase-related serine hydrolase [Kitasatospora sp. NBC_00240]
MSPRHRARRRRHRPLRTGLFTLLAAVATAVALSLGTGGGQLVARPAATAPIGDSGSPSATAAALPEASARAARTVGEAVADAGADAEGAVAVSVLDLDSGVTAGSQLPGPDGATPGADADDDGTSGAGGHAFVTASIVKADILAALLRQTDTALPAAQRTLAESMIEQSDNDAASELYQAIGGADGLDEANRAFGLTRTTAGRDGYWGLTTTTTEDQLRLLRVIFTADSPLDADDRGYLQDLMSLIADGQDWGVSAAADPDGAAKLKNGWLSRSTDGLWAVNSIGLVTRDGRDLLVAVLSDGNSTEESGIALVESVAVAAVEALVPGGAD